MSDVSSPRQIRGETGIPPPNFQILPAPVASKIDGMVEQMGGINLSIGQRPAFIREG